MDNENQGKTDADAVCFMLFIIFWAIVVIAGIAGGVMYLWSIISKGLGLG